MLHEWKEWWQKRSAAGGGRGVGAGCIGGIAVAAAVVDVAHGDGGGTGLA